nr:MAG TPA: hypothetical protein [Bacteriophage sp.]
MLSLYLYNFPILKIYHASVIIKLQNKERNRSGR